MLLFDVVYGANSATESVYVEVEVFITPGCPSRTNWPPDTGLPSYGILEEQSSSFTVSRSLPPDEDGISWSEVCGYAVIDV